MLPLLLSLTLSLPLLVVADDSLRLVHRVYIPSLPNSPFYDRGSLALAPHPAFLPAPDLHHQDLLALLDPVDPLPLDALYQVALVTPDHPREQPWHISSVKACHLRASTAESIVLHLASDSPSDASPYALDYFLHPVPHDGACPPGSPSAPVTLPPLNTTVTVSAPRQPPLPELRAPPQLTPQGEPARPVQEKNFLQKYWIYIALALGAMMLAPSPPEEGGAAQG